MRPQVQERTQGHWKGSFQHLGQPLPTATGMTHTSLGSFSKMCQGTPQSQRPPTEQRPPPSPGGAALTLSIRSLCTPYFPPRSLWSSLQRDDTALSPRLRTGPRRGRGVQTRHQKARSEQQRNASKGLAPRAPCPRVSALHPGSRRQAGQGRKRGHARASGAQGRARWQAGLTSQHSLPASPTAATLPPPALRRGSGVRIALFL